MLFKFVTTLTLAVFCSTAMALDIYVSPTGSDKLDGSSAIINVTTKTGPFKSLAKAQQVIRDLKTAGKFTQPITVHVGKGTYQLKTALEFDARDSGEPGKEILWQGEPRATLITGGIKLANCQAYDPANPEQILSCPLPATTTASITTAPNNRILGNAPQFEVFVNDHRMTIARWPDYGWAHIRQPLTTRTKYSVYEKMPAFTGDLSNAQVHILAGNDYFDQYNGVSALDTVNNQITLSSDTGYNLAPGRRFYLQNFESAVTIPEEWFYDQANNRLLFVPPYDVVPTSVVISTATNLIKINNAAHIEMSDLAFRHSTDNAISINNSNAIALQNLEINNVGGRAVSALKSTHITITNSHLHDTGLGGIFISGGDRPSLTASGNIIHNNYIHDFSSKLLNYAGAVDTNGVGSSITHNIISSAPGGAIFVNGNDHLIEKNEIASICQETNDCGAVYSGRDWTHRGNVVRYNYIHDLYGYGLIQEPDFSRNYLPYAYSGARGIYLDDGASGFSIIGNLLVNAGSMSIHLGGGRDTRIENNIIKTNRMAIYVDTRSPFYNWDANRNSLTTMPVSSPVWLAKYPALGVPMAHDTWPEGNSIQRNLVISTAYLGYSLRYQMPKALNIIANNLYWHAGSQIRLDYKILDFDITKGGALWSDWMAQGVEINSVNADPCVQIVGSKVSLTCTTSPTKALGIKGLPSDIGRI